MIATTKTRLTVIFLPFMFLLLMALRTQSETGNLFPPGNDVSAPPADGDIWTDGAVLEAPPEDLSEMPPLPPDTPQIEEPHVPDVFLVPSEELEPFVPAEEDRINDTISVMLDEVMLQDVVRMFTRITGANIIASGANLQDLVTVSLENVHWKTALESILDMHNMTLRERIPGSGVYSVTPKAPDAPDPMLVEPVFLKYANVADARSIVETLLDAGGSVSAYSSGNALVLRSTAANLAEIISVIEKIDRPRQQVYIEAKFLELDDAAIKNLGINWQVLEGYRIGLREIAWDMEQTRSWERSREDRSRHYDERSQVDSVREYYDVEGVQYQDETRTWTVLPDDSVIPETRFEPTRTIEDHIRRGRDVSTEHRDSYDRSIRDVRSAVLSADDLTIILSALQEMEGVSIVSNPKIIVANEEEATIHIGEKERPFIASVESQPGDRPSIVTYNPGEEVDFGVKLSVTPTINTDSNITVRIVPELTRFVRDAQAPDGQTYPVVATKTIRTVFSLENGKTAAIGGLTETMERDEVRKVPLLGDIPLLGKYLFSHEHRRKAQKETIIFVTVGIADPYTIKRDEGLPEDAELVHRHLRRDELRRRSAEEMER